MYDPSYIRRFYDEYGEREWVRFSAEAAPANQVNFHVHRHYLQQYIRPGDTALEAGAGAGRFTIELARLGARVWVGDISPGQLALNEQKVAEAGCAAAVIGREVLDIVDLARFPAAHFDAVVCYGGVLSYVYDQADQALGELLRVTRSGGYLLLSVMSLLGSTRAFLPPILGIARDPGAAVVERVNATGDLSGDLSPHHAHMYRWSELAALLGRHPCTLVAASAANFLALNNEAAVQEIMTDTALWEAFLRWELDFSKEPGALDGGTHILFAFRRDPAPGTTL